MNISAQRLKEVTYKFLILAGSKEEEASIVADHLVEANLKGHDSHGVGMLVEYSRCIHDGLLHPNTPLRLVNDIGAVLQFAGDRGYGQRIGKEAMFKAIERAKQLGVCLMTLAKPNHLGRIGTYAEQAAAAGMVSIHFVNVVDFSKALVAPFCGSKARFGTNPICVAMPKTPENPAFVLDFATSIVAMGKTRVAYLAGKKFDEDVMLDGEGAPTNDPGVLWEGEREGVLRAIANHKGGGLIMACEFLAGLLSGGGTSQPENERKGAIVNNMTTIVIDPTKLAPREWLGEEYDAMIRYVRSSPAPSPEEHPILISGEPEIFRKEDRLTNGIEISNKEWADICEAGKSFGMGEEDFY